MLDGEVDHIVRQLQHVAGLEVVPAEMREARVEHRLVDEERLPLAEVDDRRAELLHRPHHPLAVLDRAGVAGDHNHDRLPVELVGHERERGRLAVDDDRHQLVGRICEPLAVETQNLG